jgi:putative Holliday junction resolvase
MSSILSSPEELAQRLNGPAPLIGLDLGTKTIGVAVSDRLRTIATPRFTIKRAKFTADAEQLLTLAADESAAGFILGLPVNMDGSQGPRVQSTHAFARNLAKLTELPILLWDERLSTAAVERVLIESDRSRAAGPNSSTRWPPPGSCKARWTGWAWSGRTQVPDLMAVFESILPIFALVIIGNIVRRTGLIPDPDWRGIELVCFWLLFPALLCITLARIDLATMPIGPLSITMLAMTAVLWVLLFALKPLLHARTGMDNAQFTSVFQAGSRFHGFIALAIVLKLFGEGPAAYVASDHGRAGAADQRGQHRGAGHVWPRADTAFVQHHPRGAQEPDHLGCGRGVVDKCFGLWPLGAA